MELANIHNATLTMNSREIADLTGKEHRNVMADIRKMLTELHGEGGMHSFEHTHTNPQNGQIYPIFNLPKRETLILVSGYSVQMRARTDFDPGFWLRHTASAPGCHPAG